MEPRLPKTIVVPSELYQRCLGYLLWELWDEETFGWFGDDIWRDNPADLPASATPPACVKKLERALISPWWTRRQHVAEEWDRRTERDVAAWLVGLTEGAKRHELLRVNPRRLPLWILRLPRQAARRDEASDEICAGLVATYDYCVWLSHLGDPDIGRWIARYVEESSR